MSTPSRTPGAVRFEARLGSAKKTVEIQPLGDGRYRARVGDRELELDAQEVERGVFSVLVGARALEADVTRAGEKLCVELSGRVYELELHDARRHRRGHGAGVSNGTGGHVVAPMPGKVVKLLVAPGATVEEGQGVVVVEAMKMENELRAPRAGTVRDVRVSVGQAVEIREVLITIE